MSVTENQRVESRQFAPTDMLPFIQSPEADKQVELKSLEISVSVTGIYAETTQVMHFYNPNDRPFSGELVFPLPDNAVVCEYALDIDGLMRDGVIVPKKEARKILEAEERKGADPGFIEQVQGNLYKTRIYPFPARGTRRVSITYMSDLTVQENEAAYLLPLHHAENIEEVSLRIEVNQAPSRPQIFGGQGNVSLTQWKQAWVAETKMRKGMSTSDLLIRLPDLSDELVMVEETVDGDCYFCISKAVSENIAEKEWIANNITIAWDASGSRNDISRDLEFLKALFLQWQETSVNVVIFRNKIDEKEEVFTIKEGNSQDLIEFLKNIPCDGATDLSSLDFSSFTDGECDAYLLFSDGMNTLNGELPRVSGTSIYAINSNPNSNAPFLQYLAEESGGQHINLLQIAPENAVAQIIARGATSTIINSHGCESLSVRTANGRVNIAGCLIADSGTITLQNKKGLESDIVIEKKERSIGSTIARQWAGHHIHKLNITEPSQSETVLDLARRFGIVSSGTSLLVLENVEQYVEYGIEPPSSLPEMCKEYENRIKNVSDKEQGVKQEHLESVVEKWNERVAWWGKEYKGVYQKPEEHQVQQRHSLHSQEVVGSEELSISDDSILGDFVGDDSQESACYSLRSPEVMPSAPGSLDDGQSHESEVTEALISIQPWNPDTPYLADLKNSEPAQRYQLYLRLCQENKKSPSFFLDCGDYFIKENEKELGIRILSNLLEMGLDDVALMRIYAWRLQQAEEFDAAIAVFERVLELRDDEPQSYRDLGLALGDRWLRNRVSKDLNRSLECLYKVVTNEWDRFPEIEIIALMELNRLVHLSGLKPEEMPGKIDKRLIKNLDLDLRISMSWDADMTDVDLHVFEPSEEHAYYGHNLTIMGGLVSKDFTDGYGPEEYVLKKARPGKYRIKAHYFGSHQQGMLGPCTVTATVFTNYGRGNEAKQVLTLRLDESGDDIFVGEVEIENGNKPVKSL